MQGEITLKFRGTRDECDEWAFGILGQDPMGELDQPVQVQVGGFVGRGYASGFVCGGTSRESCEATITVHVRTDGDWSRAVRDAVAKARGET